MRLVLVLLALAVPCRYQLARPQLQMALVVQCLCRADLVVARVAMCCSQAVEALRRLVAR